MTYYYRNYTFSAFGSSDLGGAMSKGKVFTMPAAATQSITVRDNDGFLSGDSLNNERADDTSGQYASIKDAHGNEIGNGTKAYAETVWTLKGSDGNTYQMVEVEQSGSLPDSYTFYNGGPNFYGTPPAGVSLTAVGCSNVKGNYLDYKCFDAGPAAPATGSVSGNVFCDLDCDGVNDSSTTTSKGSNLLKNGDFEAGRTVYNSDGFGSWYDAGSNSGDVIQGTDNGSFSNASNNEIFELDCGSILCQNFSVAKAGTYCLTFDTYKNSKISASSNDFTVKINGQTVKVVNVTADGQVTVQLQLSAGSNRIDFVSGSSVGGKGAAVDNIELREEITTTTTEPGKAGVTVKLVDTAGNTVATTTTDANGDYNFANVNVGNYKVMVVAPNGQEFTVQDAGNNDGVDSDVNANGMSGTINVTAGSDTVVDAGLKDAPQPGSLSGRYFCDDDRNGVDDGEPGVSGVTVELLDAAGNPTGITTTTAADGSYSFGGLAAGTYGVKFTDTVSGKTLIAKDVGNNDAIDSDATDIGGGMSTITGISVVAGQDTPDNDAGVEAIPQPGSLSGRYFCDDDRNGVDDGEPGVSGVTVELLDAAGNPTGITTTTAADGSYSFGGLAAGTYGVKFTDTVSGKTLIAKDVGNNDAIDSDATDIGGGMSTITGISVVAGQDTPDNDAGVEVTNTDPTPSDDAGKTCADEAVKIDVLANDVDPDTGDNSGLTITQVGGTDIAEGQTITVSGVSVMLMNGQLNIDGSGNAALDALDINESTVINIDYTVSDGNGGTGTATAAVEFCGTANTVASLEATLPTGDIKFQIIDENNPAPQGGEMWTMKLSQTGDARFEGLVIQEAYCVAVFDPILSGITGEDIDGAPMNFGTISLLDDASIIGSSITNIKSGVAADEVDNMINWILNQDFGSQGYTDAEIQGAIWGLTDDTAFVAEGGGDLADAIALCDLAVANGGNFVAGAGDVIGLYIDPNAATEAAGHAQPFVVAVNFDDIDCIC